MNGEPALFNLGWPEHPVTDAEIAEGLVEEWQPIADVHLQAGPDGSAR